MATTSCDDSEITLSPQLEYENVDESLLNLSNVVTELTSNAITIKKGECAYLYLFI